MRTRSPLAAARGPRRPLPSLPTPAWGCPRRDTAQHGPLRCAGGGPETPAAPDVGAHDLVLRFEAMRRWHLKGQTLFGAALLCVGLFGCAAQHDDIAGLSAELARARTVAAAQQAHAAELEARLTRLEQQSASGRSAEEGKLSTQIDRLLDVNERLLLARNTPAPIDAQPPAAAAPRAPLPTSPKNSAALDTAQANEEQQLRALVERMRGRAGSLRGGLTVEQENALRVLLRSERKLDSENPLLPAFY